MAALLTNLGISIHAPREGGDYLKKGWKVYTTEFQSTPPARGATEYADSGCYSYGHFNPRPPRGGRPLCFCAGVPTLMISIHAPREGGDYINGV